MQDPHVMVNEARTPSEALYVCDVDGCGRRIVINWLRPGLTVVDRGDFFARHVGTGGGLSIGLAVEQP